jgi:regulator of replication initiation timing
VGEGGEVSDHQPNPAIPPTEDLSQDFHDDQPKPTTGDFPECCWCGQEMSKHDMSHDAKAMPPQPLPPTTGEWTEEEVRNLLLTRIGGGYGQLVTAINAALAAERKRAISDTLTACEGQVRQLEQQLAAEREEVKRLIADKVMLHEANQQLREQLAIANSTTESTKRVLTNTCEKLAAAQAAFVKLKSAIRDVHWHGKPLSETLNIDITDTTALNAAIATARQPLVDGLCGIRKMTIGIHSVPAEELRNEIDALFAKVKEGK